MTVIAAYATKDRVIMGCDTATDHAGTSLYSARGKIGVTLSTGTGDRILIGVAGNSAIGPTLDRCLEIEATPGPDCTLDSADLWANHVAQQITQILADANPPLISTQNGSADTFDGNLLLAWNRHVWLVCAHAAIRPENGIAAIGSGRDLALGSLHTTDAYARFTPEYAVHRAVSVACTYDSGCGVDERGPILHSTKEAA